MQVQGVRGAITTTSDQPDDILSATKELLQAILKANPSLISNDIGSTLFTVTEDLTSVFPAKAAREFGWQDVPLMCSREIPVPGSLPRCIRVLLHWNTNLKQKEINHVYLREAISLRPDLQEEVR
ncbi:MAG: chorismate mutase [Chloroflexi bacterium]|nr:chorismate mutase [Chloroflexota bacterium]